MTAPGPPAREDGRWILRSRDLLDAAARGLDAAACERLDAARRAALASVAPTAPAMPAAPADAAEPGVPPCPPARQAPPAPPPSRLRLERRRNPRPPRPGPNVLGWAAVGAGIVVLAVVLVRLLPGWLPQPQVSSAPMPPPAVRIAPEEDTPLAAPDFDLLVDGEDEALLQDLAFYAWLDAGGADEG